MGLGDEVEPSSVVPICKLHTAFPDVAKQYFVQRVIGTGTFSTVFRAIDLNYNTYINDAWDHADKRRYNTRRCSKEPHVVAIKQIHATASPIRVQRELEILRAVRATGCQQALSIVTGLRHEDQILIVMPYGKYHLPDR